MKQLNPVVMSLVSLAVLSMAACGGDSKSFSGPSSGGSAGSSSAGKGGAGGTGGGSGGTGGSTAGSTGSGGSGGKAGSTGTGSGGTGGSSGSGTGGDAGDGTGGSAMAGSGGGGKSGYVPPMEQVDACTRLCAEAVLAECPNAEPLATCVANCQVAIRIEPCSAEWDALFACQDAVDTVECNDDGEPSWPGCDDEYVLALACVYGDALDPDLEAPCQALCEAEESVTCANSMAVADCTTECQFVGAVVPVCQEQMLGYLECGAMADEFTCDAEGDPQPAGCAGPSLTFLACVITEYDITL